MIPGCSYDQTRPTSVSDLVCTVILVGVRARGPIGGVCLFGELFDRSEPAVPAVGDLGQRAGCFGEALFADFVADFASLKCKGPMRVIALIEDPVVVRAILMHLGLWQPKAVERAPPVPPSAWPTGTSLPLTYHPVPEIA